MWLWPSAASGELDIYQRRSKSWASWQLTSGALFVWRAAASALHYLGQRQPEAVRPVLEGWLEDEQRAQAAEVALRYIPNPEM